MILGTGRLHWQADERRTDRWGSIHLGYGEGPRVRYDSAPVGTVGALSVKLLSAEQSVFTEGNPLTVGEVVELGEGELFVEEWTEAFTVGVKPLDGRPDGWMDSKAIYRVSRQMVELYFEPTGQ